jgi:hypothetical protein
MSTYYKWYLKGFINYTGPYTSERGCYYALKTAIKAVDSYVLLNFLCFIKASHLYNAKKWSISLINIIKAFHFIITSWKALHWKAKNAGSIYFTSVRIFLGSLVLPNYFTFRLWPEFIKIRFSAVTF